MIEKRLREEEAGILDQLELLEEGVARKQAGDQRHKAESAGIE